MRSIVDKGCYTLKIKIDEEMKPHMLPMIYQHQSRRTSAIINKICKKDKKERMYVRVRMYPHVISQSILNHSSRF